MTFHPHLAYSASAGSGKTFALAARYVSLLFLGESPATILAATFTNKAAAEMRQRVVDSLRKMGEEKNRAFVEAIAQQTGFSREELLTRQPEVLQRFLRSPNHIVTLDSFFASVLRSSSLEIGLEPTFATQERDPNEIADRFLGELLHDGLLQKMASLAHQIEDKRFAKILGLLHHFYTVDPLLPTPPAAGDTPFAALEAHIESLRLEMIAALQSEKAAARALKQWDAPSTQALFGKKFWEHSMLGNHSWFAKYTTPAIEDLYRQLKSALAEWVQLREARVLHDLFILYDHYRNARIAEAKFRGVLGFDDLAYFTYRLLYASIDREFLYFRLDARFHHILLDEFQDTSTLQFLLLKPLIDEIFAGQGQSELRSFFYVGDTKQSLYRFRGGVEELFDQVAARYGITIQPMATNYRSSSHVVEQVNRWFEQAIDGYTPQTANGLRDAQGNPIEGYVHVQTLTEEDDPIETAMDRAQHLHTHGIDWDDMAFLVHTNADGHTLAEALAHASIPTRLKTSNTLKTHLKIAPLVAMMEYLYRGAPIDAEAMLTRIGTTLSDVQIEGYTAFMSPLQMADRLVREFGYFDDDPNVLRLLEFAGAFDDVATFLEEFAASDIHVAAHTVHGAQIMTIHGSKGLEFDHVILLDRLTRPRPDTSPLLFDYRDDLSIERIFYRTKGRENIDPRYAHTLDRQQTATHKDRLNLLYVATTRAVIGLTVLRKEKQSVFDILGMEEMDTGSIPTITPPASATQPETKPHTPTLHNYGYQEKPAQEEDKERDHAAILFGTALHYGLEMLSAFTAESVDDALTAVRNRYGHLLALEQLSDIRTRITRLLTHPEFTALLSGAIPSREQSLAYRNAFKQIDLLLEYPDRYCVIDYKSSPKYANHHRQQVAHYIEAIESITGKPTEGKVAYLLEDRVEVVGVG